MTTLFKIQTRFNPLSFTLARQRGERRRAPCENFKIGTTKTVLEIESNLQAVLYEVGEDL